MKRRQGNYFKIKVGEGQRFNKLTVIKEVERFVQPSGQGQRGFLCRCDCGNLKKVRLSHLRHNRVKSCGCESSDLHGDTGMPLHNIWRGMVNRAKDSYDQSYLYAERGITVCDQWGKSYIAFRKWALKNGYKEGLTIDRIDNEGNYEPGNCRFVTQAVNNCNKRNTLYVNYKGRKRSLTLLLKEKRVFQHYSAIFSRIQRGWNPERAIDTPIRKGNYRRGKTFYEKLQEES
jgi:hypothetical protein